MIQIKNKVVVVIGANGLLGSEILKAVNSSNATAISADIAHDGFKNDNIYINITDKDSIMHAIDVICKKHKKIDAVINAAYPRNKNYGRDFLDVDYNDFCENINTHLGGYFLVSQLFGKFFLKQGFGNIINISSIYGVTAPHFELYENTQMTMPIEYAAIKSSIIHLTKYIAKYFKNKNIRVNCISPGGIFDNQNEQFVDRYRQNCLNKGMLDKSDISGTVLFLLSEMSNFINGQNIIVDDGFVL